MQIKNKYNFPVMISIMLAITLLLTSCDENPVVSTVVLPSNFTTIVSVNEGTVNVTASATAVNFYTFTFVEDGETTVVESNDGFGSYTYSSSGTFTITSRAHALYADFVEIIDTVEVTVDPGWNGETPTIGYETPLSYPGYTLVWQDEFSGTALSADWVHDIGTGASGWGNNELQYYRQENVEVVGGLLKITAKQENFGGKNYTSSRIKTQGKKSFEKGRIDIRAALPYGKGIWPALWMLGDNITAVGWPACGEIDIMELIGGEGFNDRTVYGTIHWDNDGSNASYGGSNSLATGKYAEEFHVFSIVWTETSIKWLRDDIQYQTADISPAALSEFHDNFFFIMNVAVGGDWPGSPDGSTIFPQVMAVDYVRVFQ